MVPKRRKGPVTICSGALSVSRTGRVHVWGFISALTGCDSTSSLAGIGKKTDWVVLKRSAAHQNALRLVGQREQLNERTAAKVEAYVCDLYPTSKITATAESK